MLQDAKIRVIVAAGIFHAYVVDSGGLIKPVAHCAGIEHQLLELTKTAPAQDDGILVEELR